ncbi:uncharacterized protein HD556DRAFT_1451687 [Suillus plorans]|uniref:Uncharacterized protein n=1 Tax=Suillus plorans TaxID=116603 RepID=A0A9P7DAE1_9AGAM|nr:uncharacterized protein HD556DRAFT_1451687 [Suillus plorans]KAG1784531.1 hypothetical protein HD556DRAFT_1451687 [Suillus plorans]
MSSKCVLSRLPKRPSLYERICHILLFGHVSGVIARFEEPWDIADRVPDAQRLWDRCFTGHSHTLQKKNDLVFFLIKQCTYDWRSMFATCGEKAVTAFISRQVTGFDTPVEIEAYVEWAVPQTQAFHDDEGRGNAPPILPFMWANVDESDSENPIGKGPFQHETILDTFAFYLESIAAIPDGLWKTSSPKAALALATVAVERAWKQWATGELVQDSFDDKFSSAMWNLPTQEVLESIDKLKPRTWTKILEGAAHFIGAHKPKSIRAQQCYTGGAGLSGRALCYESESESESESE